MSLDQQIYDLAISEGFSPTSAKLIVAQARLESANYGSNVFKNNNNMYGMKFVGQPLATRGTLAPMNERSASCKSGGTCVDRDFYAKYNTPTDSAKDVIQRLYKKTRKGIGFNELKSVSDSTDFATKLKTRDYYGFHDISTPEGKSEAQSYAKGLDARLKNVSIIEKVVNVVTDKKKIKFAIIGLALIGISAYGYRWYKKMKR